MNTEETKIIEGNRKTEKSILEIVLLHDIEENVTKYSRSMIFSKPLVSLRHKIFVPLTSTSCHPLFFGCMDKIGSIHN